MSVKIAQLISDFESAMGYPYVTPGNTSMSTIETGVDCSGLFVAAFKNQRASIYHGSNTIARQYLTEREKLTKTSQLKVGAAVFKWKNNGGEPEKYQNDGLGNFHHIGLVASVNPVRIIHASSVAGCVTTDSSIKNWQYVGLLKSVDYDYNSPQRYEQETIGMTNVKVIASSLRIRKSPSTKSDVLGSLPFGTVVEIDSKTNGWYKLANSDGFISAEYVEVVGDAPVETETTPTAMTIEQRLSVLEEKLSAMEAVVYGDQ